MPRSFTAQCVRELRFRIEEARASKAWDAILSDSDRLWRCLDRIGDNDQRRLLELVFNHSMDIPEAFAELGLNLAPMEMDRRLRDAMKELHRLMIEDWRESQDPLTGEED